VRLPRAQLIRRIRSLRLTAVIVAALAIPILGAQHGAKDGQDLPPSDLVRVQAGQTAPDFTLARPGGESLTLSSLRGKNVVLVFYRGHW